MQLNFLPNLNNMARNSTSRRKILQASQLNPEVKASQLPKLCDINKSQIDLDLDQNDGSQYNRNSSRMMTNKILNSSRNPQSTLQRFKNKGGTGSKKDQTSIWAGEQKFQMEKLTKLKQHNER